MIGDVPTVARLRALLAPLLAESARREAEAARLEDACHHPLDGCPACDAYEAAALSAVMHNEHEAAPLAAQLASAEAAAHEARHAERLALWRMIGAVRTDVLSCDGDGGCRAKVSFTQFLGALIDGPALKRHHPRQLVLPDGVLADRSLPGVDDSDPTAALNEVMG